MRDIRKEIADVTRYFDILLNSEEMNAPLNPQEKELLEAYVLRVREKLHLSCLGAQPRRAEETHQQSCA